jgi:hypothetical protein
MWRLHERAGLRESRNGTAPIDASSGDQVRHRLLDPLDRVASFGAALPH